MPGDAEILRTLGPSEAQLRSLVEQARDGIFIADPKGRYTYINEAGCRMLGYDRHELIGKTIADLIPPTELARLWEEQSRMLEGLAEDSEWTLRRKDGTWLPVEVSAQILSDGQWQAFVRDIRERKAHEAEREAFEAERARAQERLRKKQRLLQSIFDILPVGIWIAGRDGRLLQNNPAGDRIWASDGGAVADFANCRGWWADSDEPIAPEEWALARALGRGETSIGELVRIQCFDGSFKTILNSAMPLRDDAGEIEGAIVVNEDVTALHHEQEQRRAGEELLRTVIELLPVGVWIAGRDGRITLANPAGERIWRGTQQIAPGDYGVYRGWRLETGEPIAADSWAINRALRYGETSRSERIRIKCFDGTFKTVINWAAPILSPAGDITGAVAVNEDITALQLLQDQLRAAVTDREHMLAIVAHDLRNPLAVIAVGLSAISGEARSLPQRGNIGTLAATLHDTASRMSGLVDDLLAIAVATAGRSMLATAAVSAAELIALAESATRTLLEPRRIQLEVLLGERAALLSVDTDRILRVFANLADNAAKFTAREGKVTLACEPIHRGVRFSMANTGPAVTEAELKRMFQPFWQAAREDTRGAGLGLSICRAIVEAHGGTIWAEAAAGQRLRICFILPAGDRAEEAVTSGR